MTRKDESVIGALDSLEAVVVGLAATAAFVSLVVVLPISIAKDLLQDSQYVWAGAFLFASLLLVGTTLRDVLERRWSPLSRVAAGLWFLLFIVIALLG